MTSIARENNISINTVQRVLGNCSHRFIDSYEYLPAHLAFDEFKGVDRQLHFICLDGDNHQVVQILRTRYKKTLLKSPWKLYLKSLMNLKKFILTITSTTKTA